MHSNFWGRGDCTLGYIHMSIGADQTTPIHSDLIYIVVYKHVFVFMWRLGVYIGKQ